MTEPNKTTAAEENENTVYTAEQVEAEKAKATEGIRAQLSEERKMRKEHEKQLADLQAQLDTMKTEAEQRVQEKQNTELEEKGKYAEALENLKKKQAEELTKVTSALEEANKTIEVLLVDKEIFKAAAKDSNKPEDIVDLMKLRGLVKVNKGSDGKYVVETFDNNGVPLFDDEGKPASVEYAVQQYLLENPHQAKANILPGSGATTGKLPGKKSIDDQIKEAHERGDTLTVYKLKNIKMSQEGPHSLLQTKNYVQKKT